MLPVKYFELPVGYLNTVTSPIHKPVDKGYTRPTTVVYQQWLVACELTVS